MALILALASCKQEKEDEGNKLVIPMPDPDDVYHPPSADDDTSETTPTRSFNMTLETRNTIHVSWTEDGDEITSGEVTAGSAYGYGNDILMAGLPLPGQGRILRFPEAGFVIHTFNFQSPAIKTSLCGNEHISYALTLTGQENALERYGGISAYCGDDMTGMPVRILRIYGKWK